jgi:hypothetical protein
MGLLEAQVELILVALAEEELVRRRLLVEEQAPWFDRLTMPFENRSKGRRRSASKEERLIGRAPVEPLSG